MKNKKKKLILTTIFNVLQNILKNCILIIKLFN